MDKKVIALGTNEDIINTVVRLMDKMEGYQGKAVLTVEALKDCLTKDPHDIVLICSGYENETIATITQQAAAILPDIKVIEHFGGGSGLLLSELESLK